MFALQQKSYSLHRASEPCHLSRVETMAALILDERSAQARAVDTFGLPVGRQI